MFYLIVAILIVSYYFFMAPTSIRNTLNTIGLVGAMALLIVLAFMSYVPLPKNFAGIYHGDLWIFRHS